VLLPIHPPMIPPFFRVPHLDRLAHKKPAMLHFDYSREQVTSLSPLIGGKIGSSPSAMAALVGEE